MLCGAVGQYHRHLRHLVDIIGLDAGRQRAGGAVGADPAEGHVLPLRHLCRRGRRRGRSDRRDDGARGRRRCGMFGVEPKVALLSHSNFGSSDARLGAERCARRWRCCASARPSSRSKARCMPMPRSRKRSVTRIFPEFAAEGRGQSADHAQSRCRQHRLQLLKMLGDGLAVGPILLGTATARRTSSRHRSRCAGLLNMTAVAVYDAQVSAVS